MAQKPLILIADDEAINRDILRSSLGDEYEILEAADGQETIHLLTEHEKELEAALMAVSFHSLHRNWRRQVIER